MTLIIRSSMDYKGDAVAIDLWASEPSLEEFNLRNYIYEPEVLPVIMHFLQPGDRCIDAGANIGYHTLLMSKRVGEKGEVYAFEPDPGCMGKLVDNLNLNKVNNVCPLPFLLWSESGERTLYMTPDRCGYSSCMPYSNVSTVQAQIPGKALDDIMNLDVPFRLLKIDCEGAEEYILHGAEKLLRRGIDAVIVEFNYRTMEAFKHSDQSIRGYMEGLGYDFFYLHDGGQTMPTYIPPQSKIELNDGRWHFNGLFSKRELVERMIDFPT